MQDTKAHVRQHAVKHHYTLDKFMQSTQKHEHKAQKQAQGVLDRFMHSVLVTGLSKGVGFKPVPKHLRVVGIQLALLNHSWTLHDRQHCSDRNVDAFAA